MARLAKPSATQRSRSTAPRPALRSVMRRYLKEFDGLTRVAHDAVRFPRRYRSDADREVAGLLGALFAFGRVASFATALEDLQERLGPSPMSGIKKRSPRDLVRLATGFRYRWVGESELARLLLGIQGCLERHGTLRQGFEREMGQGPDYRAELGRFVDELEPDPARSRLLRAGPSTAYRNLLTHPARGSACKRLNLYLRWMVRPEDGVDMGVWSGLDPSRLTIPLDTHVLRVARHLGLTRSKTQRWATAAEITEGLRRVDARDPVGLDFALCHLGMSGTCPVVVNPDACAICPLRKACVTAGH